MKKLLLSLAMLLCVLSLCCCGASSVSEEQTQEQTQTEEELKAQEEAKAEEEAKKAEEELKKKEAEEAKQAEELKAKEEKEAQEAAAKEAEEKAKLLEDGLAEDVDREQIVMFEEAKTMYLQKNANVRKGPSTSYDKVDYYELNKEVTVVGRYGEKGWYLIKYGDKNAFISNDMLGDAEVDLEALKAQKEAEAMAAIQQQQAATQNAQTQQGAPAEAAPATPVMAPAGILFIGDSRCVQMREAVGGGNSSWICEGGKGYKWLSETAIGQADPCIGKGTKVVICLGVNDVGNGASYAALINQKAAEWAARGAKTYFVSVNPVWENPWVTEEQVVNFNSYIVGQLSGVRWIDTHTALVNSGYYLVDGLHYDTDTYVRIFNMIVGSLK